MVLGYILINVMGVETSGYIEFKHFLKLFEYLKYPKTKVASLTPRISRMKSPDLSRISKTIVLPISSSTPRYTSST